MILCTPHEANIDVFDNFIVGYFLYNGPIGPSTEREKYIYELFLWKEKISLLL